VRLQVDEFEALEQRGFKESRKGPWALNKLNKNWTIA
jgi:hypothetical protein